MPLVFIYFIGIAIIGIVALVAPHYRHFAFVMCAFYSLFAVLAGSYEVYRTRRKD